MSHAATERFRLRAAPGGLALVQDFLNTRTVEPYADRVPDLLADRAAAEAWVTQATRAWVGDQELAVPAITLGPADLRALRQLRSALADLTASGRTDPGTFGEVPATLVPGPDGVVRLWPSGSGWRWLASALWIEAWRAQQDGTWPRLKLCRNTVCASAFYDTSRNNSGVWHDVRTCGNQANLRAARERKRAQA